MRTNIEIDDGLISEAMSVAGVRTKREAVHVALSELIAYGRRRKVANHFGMLGRDGWDGDLDAMRTDDAA